MSAPLLITGATGQVGVPLLQFLDAAGAVVRPVSRTMAGAEGVRFDFTDPATWAAAFSGVQTMFLVRPPQLGNVNRDIVPALAAARDAGVRHVVLLSVQGAGRVPVLPHARLERWLRKSGLDWTFIRPSYFDQNLSGVFASDIRDRDQIVVPAGSGRTAFVDARDVAALASAVLLNPPEHAGRIWTPTGEQALTYGEVADALSTILGRQITYTHPGIVAYVRHARTVLGMSDGMAATTAVIHAVARLGLAHHRTDDIHLVTGNAPISFLAFAWRERQAWT